MKLNLDIDLKPKQLDVYRKLNSGAYDDVLFYGSGRSGKTFVILKWLIDMCLAFGANILIARNTFSSMQSGLIRQTLPSVLKAIANANGKRKINDVVMANGSKFCEMDNRDHVLKFFTGAYIQFASLRQSADVEISNDKILSTEWGFIFVDEVSEVDEMTIGTLRSRLAQKIEGEQNMMLFALNPTSKLHWTYKRFFLHRDPEGKPLNKEDIDRFLIMQFKIEDNEGNISRSYKKTLMAMSSMQRKRFLDGEYADASEGEIFKSFTWGNVPENVTLKKVVIYTDPSAKDQKTNDYKATAMLGLGSDNKIYLLDVRAVQGTSRQMLENIYELWLKSPISPYIFMENKQLPLDFAVTFEQFQAEKNWVCPLKWDNRQHGDKFTMIESTLEPLFEQKRFVFCDAVKDSGVCEITIDQFVRFSKKVDRNRKDDIPDACAKGTSILIRDIADNSMSNGDAETMIISTGKRMTI